MASLSANVSLVALALLASCTTNNYTTNYYGNGDGAAAAPDSSIAMSMDSGGSGGEAGIDGEASVTPEAGVDAAITNGNSGSPTDGGTDGAGCMSGASIGFVMPGADGGTVENTGCEMCVGASCSVPQCDCLTDNVNDAGAPACGDYARCVYGTFVQIFASDDAGVANAAADLQAAQLECAPGVPASSVASGNTLVGCIFGSCTAPCLPQ
jgi:hypothetical protein